MVFTRKDGDFHGRTVSFREGSEFANQQFFFLQLATCTNSMSSHNFSQKRSMKDPCQITVSSQLFIHQITQKFGPPSPSWNLDIVEGAGSCIRLQLCTTSVFDTAKNQPKRGPGEPTDLRFFHKEQTIAWLLKKKTDFNMFFCSGDFFWFQIIRDWVG